jgi:hypothetical protein
VLHRLTEPKIYPERERAHEFRKPHMRPIRIATHTRTLPRRHNPAAKHEDPARAVARRRPAPDGSKRASSLRLEPARTLVDRCARRFDHGLGEPNKRLRMRRTNPVVVAVSNH